VSTLDPEAAPPWLRPLLDALLDVDRVELLPHHLEAPPPDARRAAILMLFGETAAHGPDVLLAERASTLRSHPGQVAFPGGGTECGDSGAIATALREAEEETGLDPAGVDVIGVLPTLWLPPSNFAVTPVLGWWRTPSEVSVVDPAEIASVHTVPVAELLDPDHRVTVRHPSGFLGPGFLVRDLVVWGFTAGLLSRLFAIVGWEREWDDQVLVDLPDDMVKNSMRDLERAVEAGTLRRSDLPGGRDAGGAR
jgi:8-oxo-dGTP pyrophosphatase MutT (NUDIX family)